MFRGISRGNYDTKVSLVDFCRARSISVLDLTSVMLKPRSRIKYLGRDKGMYERIKLNYTIYVSK